VKTPRIPIATAGEMIDTPRCLHPVEFYQVTRDRDEFDIVWPRTEEASVCWRPKHHESKRHVAKSSYLRSLEYRRVRGHPERKRQAS
jgi:hypothetical protein